MKRLERIVERVARSPRWLADHDLPGFLRQFVFVNRGYGALPSADIADNQEMFREVYRVKDREDRKRRFRPFVSRFFWLAVYSDAWDRWGTVIIVNAKFVASQSRLVPSGILFLWGRNKPAPMGSLSATRRLVCGTLENYLDDLVS